MLTGSRKRIFCLLRSERLILSQCTHPNSVLQSALILQIEPHRTELQETHGPFAASTLQKDLRKITCHRCLSSLPSLFI
ncbi:hypothetical protein PBY51_003865 [Eleginops maclovinus]|uniref:Uncharacterized protein n=1 Tax=Eleginops maclovinus TaxID=56733 RepID=A0AAN7XVQ7_ELEMC|nr:hypothetical protein PBY51_003865 [Eleginops maclovinus]